MNQKLKMTEVGWIPKDWEVKTISQCTDVVTGATPSTAITSYWGGNIKWMNSGELNNKLITDVAGRITEDGYNHSGTHMVPENCVLIGLAGQGKTRGTAAYNLIPLCTNQSIASILPNEKEFHSLYLFHYIDSQYDALRLLSAGDGGRGGLNKQIILSLQFPLPSTSEQRRIAQVLSDTDSLIASLSRTIEKKRLVKQGAMQQLLTGKTRLKGFSGEWMEKALGDVVYILDNKRLPLNDSQRNQGIYPYCGANGIVDYIDNYIFDEELILMAEDGGNFADYENRPIAYLMQGKYWVNNHAHVLKAKEEYCQRFIYHSIAHKNITDLIIGGTRTKLNQAVLKGIGMMIPPTFDEQFAIANILTTMDNEIASLEAELQKYKALKQGMMQKLLTGEIRLPICQITE